MAIDRRKFVQIGAAWTILGALAINDLYSGSRTIVGEMVNRIDAWIGQSSERHHLLNAIFPDSGLTQMIPGAANPLQPGVPGSAPGTPSWIHPDDAWTVTKLGCMFAGERVVCTEEEFGPAREANYICIGSPQSNAFAMEQLRYQRYEDGGISPIRDEAKGPIYRLAVDYEFPAIAAPKTILRYVDRAVAQRPIYRLEAGLGASASKLFRHNSFIQARSDSDGWLEEDWLLVTRVPNLRYRGYSATVLGGLYGTGTKGSAKLMQELPVAQLRDLDEQRELASSFQSLFKVWVAHDHGARESVVKAIRHVETFPLNTGQDAP